MNKIILKSLRSHLLDRISLDALPESVWKRSSALNTWGTNAIEGNTITQKEAENLILRERSVANRSVREVLETVQHEKAFRALLLRKNEEMTLKTVLELHEDVFRGILYDAGQWRRVNVRIVGARFTPPRMEKVVPEMTAWLEQYKRRDIEGADPIELAAWMHFRFEHVHPFPDGNGRVGRLLLNLHMLKHNWPPVHILPVNREEYLSALEAGETDLTDLIRLLEKLLASSLLDLLDQVGTKDDELMPLTKAAGLAGHSENYLALRCKQGELPGIQTSKAWKTSKRAIEVYAENIGR